MARVKIEANVWDIVGSKVPVMVEGASVEIVQVGTTTRIPVYAAASGGSPLTQPFTTDSRGVVTQTMYITSGQEYEKLATWTHTPPGGSPTTRTGREYGAAVSPSVESSVVSLTNRTAYNAKTYGATGAGLVNETALLQTGLDAAAGGVFEVPQGTYLMTSAAGTATTTNGSTSLTSVTPTTGWVNGEPIHGAGIPTGTTIVSGAGTATMVLSQAATAAASGVTVSSQLKVRPNTTVICHKDVVFRVTGTASAIEFYTPTARTPAVGYSLAANGVESAELITVAQANLANFVAGDYVQIRDSYTIGGEACHRETNIVESINSASGTATTTNLSTSLTLVTPTTGWANGMVVAGTGIPAGTTIVSGAGTATMVMSQAATASNAGVAITGASINLKYPINFAYLTANSAVISKVTPADNVHWRGGRFDMTGVVSNPGGADRDVFYIEWGVNCSIEDVTGHNFPNKIVDMYACLGSHQRRIVGYLPSAVGPGEGYVAKLTYSRDCSIRQAWGRSVRHTADVTGGSDCLVDGVFATGGIVANQIAMFLHGLESKRVRTTNVFASNVETAFGAGNGTFGADFDFVAEGIVSHRCDTSIFLGFGCTGWTVRAQTKNSTIRAATIDNCSNGYLEIACDGIVTNPSSYGAVTVSGTSSDVVVKPRIRNPIYRGVAITATSGGGKVTIFEPDIDMGTVTAEAINASTLVSTSKVLVSGGEIKMNNAAVSAISLNGPAGSQLSVERSTQISGTMLRAIAFTGGSTDQTVKGAKFRGTISEQVRADAGTLRVGGGTDFTSGTAIRLGTATAQLLLGDVDMSAATSKVVNTVSFTSTATTTSGSTSLTLVSPTTSWANGMQVSGTGIPAGTTIVSGAGTATMVMSQAATASAAGVTITGTASVLGGDALRHIVPVQTIGTDAAFTLTPGTSPENTYFTAVMAANRAVPLSTTNAWPGAHFKVTRTATSTGAFTLDIGTGPLKSLAVSQWAEVVYDGAAWKLAAFGSL